MSFQTDKKAVDCMDTSCQYNGGRTCGYPGRLVIDADGTCAVESQPFHRDPFP